MVSAVAPHPQGLRPPGAGVFVTGTGTGVGKSVVAAVIARSWSRSGLRVSAFKPAVSGLDDGGEPDHALLRRASGSSQTDEQIAPYRYGPAVSPHLGADLAGEEIDPQRLQAAARAAAEAGELLVAEGVGGLLVPLRRDYLVADLIGDLGLPAVVVANPELGTINHTLLTVEALRARRIEISAIVLNRWPPEPGTVARSNRETLAELTGLPLLTLAEIDLADPEGWPRLDPEARRDLCVTAERRPRPLSRRGASPEP